MLPVQEVYCPLDFVVASNLVTSMLYNGLGLTTEINLGNGAKTTLGYWGAGGSYDTSGGYYSRLWEIKTSKQPEGSPVLMDMKYTWDAGGNLTQQQNLVTSETETFGYDFLDRLASASGRYSESYTYDQIGNINSKGGLSYTYGTKPHAVTNVGSTSYAYDNNGNMTTRGSQTLTWDIENKLIAVSDNGTAQFVYDGCGNRVKKTEGGETILYINKYYEKNLTTGVVTTNYYLGSQLIAQRKGTDLQYIHQDHLAGTSVLSNSSGNQISAISYFPFGATRSGSVPTDIGFTGQRLDGTGLYYYGARYYDPTIGRFISSDSIVPDLYNPQALNRYSYVLNNPLRYIDPSGHWDMSPYGPTSSSTGWGDGGDGGNGNGDNGTGNPQCPNCPPDTSPNSNTACPPGCFYTTDPANPLTSHVCICGITEYCQGQHCGDPEAINSCITELTESGVYEVMTISWDGHHVEVGKVAPIRGVLDSNAEIALQVSGMLLLYASEGLGVGGAIVAANVEGAPLTTIASLVIESLALGSIFTGLYFIYCGSESIMPFASPPFVIIK